MPPRRSPPLKQITFNKQIYSVIPRPFPVVIHAMGKSLIHISREFATTGKSALSVTVTVCGKVVPNTSSAYPEELETDPLCPHCGAQDDFQTAFREWREALQARNEREAQQAAAAQAAQEAALAAQVDEVKKLLAYVADNPRPTLEVVAVVDGEVEISYTEEATGIKRSFIIRAGQIK